MRAIIVNLVITGLMIICYLIGARWAERGEPRRASLWFLVMIALGGVNFWLVWRMT